MTTTPNEHVAQVNRNMKWTPKMDKAFIEQLHKYGVELRNNNGLTRERWNAISRDLTIELGFQIGVKHLKNHYKGWKANYIQVRDLRSLSGFGWDDTRKLVEAKGVWEDLIKARPTLGRWRYQTFPLYEEMAMLMGDSHATGDLAFTYNEPGYANHSTPTTTTEVDPLNFCPTTDNGNEEGDASSPSIHTRGVNPPNERAKKRKRKDSEDKLATCFDTMNQNLSRMTNNEEKEDKEITKMRDIVLAVPDIDINTKLNAMIMLAKDSSVRKLFMGLGEKYRGLFLLNLGK